MQDLIAEVGNRAFPHSEATSTRLIDCVRAPLAKRDWVRDSIVELVHADPGFAFNVAGLFCGTGRPLGSGMPVDLRARVDEIDPFNVVSKLSGYDSYDYQFGDYPELLQAYDALARRAAAAARASLVDPEVPGEYRDVAAIMAMAESFPILAVANLVEEGAIPVLTAADAEAEETCRRILGFGLGELSVGLQGVFELPRLSNPLYPGIVREAVRRAVEAAKAKGGETGSGQATAA